MNQPPPHQDDPYYPPRVVGPFLLPAQQTPHQSQPGSWPPSTPKEGKAWKWILGGVAVLAVVGVTVAVTVAVVGKGKGSDSSPAASISETDSAGLDIASANDTGAITIITEEPTCAPLAPIMTALADAQKNGWTERDTSIPAHAWPTEVRRQYESVGEAMRKAADQLVPLARITPHRVIRELYEQSIAYLRAYADSIPTYSPRDNSLIRAASSAANAITNICSAIDYGAAAARAPLVKPLPAPSQLPPVGDLENPQRFLTRPNPVCKEWADAIAGFQRDAAAWGNTSPDIPVGQWSAEQRAINDEVIPVMKRFANQAIALGKRSDNTVLQDFAALSAVYRLAYVEAIPTYMPADKYLTKASVLASGLVEMACESVKG